MRILTGDDTGLVKLWDVEKQDVIMKFGEQSDENCISDVLFFNDSETQVLSCSRNTTLNLYEINYQKKESQLIQSILVDESKKNEIKGLHKFNGRQELLFTYENNQTYKLNYNTAESYFEDIVKVYTPENQKGVENTILNNDQNKLLVLSKGVNPQLIDIEKQTQIWKARNVKNDWLDLQVPIWDVDGYFFNNDKNIYTVNAYQKIRIYDLNKKNSQPISDFEFDHKKLNEKSPFVGLQMSHCKNYMYVYNKAGSVFKFDTRKDYQLVGKLKGANGSIRKADLHPSLPYIATVGLDRYIRVYNEDCKLVGKQNLGQRLNVCVFSKQEISVDEEEFEEQAEEKYNENYKEDKKKSQDEMRENKKKFKDMKRHTIKLDYLKPKDEKIKAIKKALKEKQANQQIEEKYEEITKQLENQQGNDDEDDEEEIDSEENPFNDSEEVGLDEEGEENPFNDSEQEGEEIDFDDGSEESNLDGEDYGEDEDGFGDEEFDSSDADIEEEEEEEDEKEEQQKKIQQKKTQQQQQQQNKQQQNKNNKNNKKGVQQKNNGKVTKNIKKKK